MPLNSNTAERSRKASQEFRLKNKIERPVTRALKGVFDKMDSTFRQVYAKTGTLPQLSVFSGDVEKVLNGAYDTTAEAFGNDITEFVADNSENQDEYLVALLTLVASTNGRTLDQQLDEVNRIQSQNLTQFKEESVAFATESIIRTKQEEMATSVQQAQEEIAQEEERPSNLLLATAALASIKFSSRFPADAERISMTEVQNGAEGAKRGEIGAVLQVSEDVIEDGLATAETFKEWHARGDSRVRQAHRDSDFDRVGVDEFFIVGGETLLFPGDRDNGASAWNTINCRCSAIYFLDGEVQRVITA